MLGQCQKCGANRGTLLCKGVRPRLGLTGGVPPTSSSVQEDNMAKIGRDAGTGQFIPVKVAISKPTTSVVETIRPPQGSTPKGGPSKGKGK